LVVNVKVVPSTRSDFVRDEQAGTMSNVPTPAIVTFTKHGRRPLESWYTTENVKLVDGVPLPGDTVPLQIWVRPDPPHTAALAMGGPKLPNPANAMQAATTARKR
jgi:hypothetical protein